MSLTAWKRCCFECLHVSAETQVRTLHSVSKQLRLSKTESRKLRSFKSLPGTYSWERSSQKTRLTLASFHQASSICERETDTSRLANLLCLDRKRKLNSMGSCALPYYDMKTGSVEGGISCAGCLFAFENEIIPWTAKWAIDARDKVYARDGFLEHFRWCEQAQHL
ncbi:hypothetical protein BDV19DRAFT_62981 [Aspergillus venezuelensis]